MSSWRSIKDIAESVNAGHTSAMSNVERSFQLMEEAKDFSAIIAVTKERALARAKEIDERVQAGENAGLLAGVPFIAKDNFLTFGSETTAASNILKGFSAPYQATAINKLEAEGAICVAKANLDAFAHGSSTENSDFFVTKNPYDKTRVPGGSSGGSAAAVALDMAPFALGTDTGGSIRLPASFCGLVGYKPSYGLVSRSGVVAMASSTDVIGPLTKTVEEAALVMSVMSGRDELDSTTIEAEKISPDKALSLVGKRIGVIKEYLKEGLEPEVEAAVKKSLESLTAAGAIVEEISLPSLPLALAVYYIICPAEVSSNLSRYDGQRYGFSAPEATSLDESYDKTRELGFGAEAKRRIMTGTYVLSSGYYDAYYEKAQLVRTKVRREFSKAFKKFDFLVGPTAPMRAFKIGERSNDPLQMYLTDIMTVAANIAGNPAISLPIKDAGDLPIGFQIIADYKNDAELFAASAAVEKII
jgi:aspartyl-tRNA(Asn)/glutamyl-tRNA(Gln) amidotransferase subunit A